MGFKRFPGTRRNEDDFAEFKCLRDRKSEVRDMGNHIKISAKELYFAAVAVLMMLAVATVTKANAVPVNSNSIVKDGIEYYIQTDKAVYNLGQDVEMLYRVTNLGTQDLMFEFAYQQQNSFETSEAQARMWGWPKLVNPAFSSFDLRPGEFKEFLIDWDMINDNTGALVFPGNFDVTGALKYFPGHDRYVPVSVQVEIIPEPTSLLLLGMGLAGLLTHKWNKN